MCGGKSFADDLNRNNNIIINDNKINNNTNNNNNNNINMKKSNNNNTISLTPFSPLIINPLMVHSSMSRMTIRIDFSRLQILTPLPTHPKTSCSLCPPLREARQTNSRSTLLPTPNQ